MTKLMRFLLVCVVAAGFAGPAFAHAKLVSSVPADKATVSQQPAEVVLTFSAAITPTFCRLLGADGAEVAAIEAVHVEGTALYVPLPPDLAAGAYTVSYGVVSDDAHPIKGAVTFTLQP